jgi:energy-coupling factor transporter ATP-binding protein EcfA2
MMADELDEFYGNVGSGKKVGGRNAPTSARPIHGRDEIIDNPGLVVNSDAAEGESRWSEGDGIFWRAKKTHEQLPSGLYNCVYVDGIGSALRKQDLNTDDLLVLPEKNSEKIFAEFEKFWTPARKDNFKKFGFLYKRGFLLWGPPGSGKTSLINLMMKTIIQRYNGIIVIIENPNIASGCLNMVRKNEPDRPLITIMEDLDALVDNYGESEYLALLDGAEQINNVIHIGTTNYPQKLDKRFVDRPSRFDTVVKIGMPGWDAREAYFKAKLSDKAIDWWDEQELEKWTRLSKGLSVAHMREMIISVCCLEQNIDDVVERLRKMHNIKLSSETDPDGAPMGFIGSNSDIDE